MNKPLLINSFKRLAYALFFCFAGPFVIHLAFQNKTHPFYYPVLILGLFLLIFALYFGFSGIKKLVNAFLGERKSKL